ncbi:hypothetical protein OHB41_11385 [Streptomyces sp. NBC_01571]|nr:hypothetical protein [Streptomyces sp. NBC_01571]MCX4573774.1 hypothetical protein [Streptomyces sp. NBC_01571]
MSLAVGEGVFEKAGITPWRDWTRDGCRTAPRKIHDIRKVPGGTD